MVGSARSQEPGGGRAEPSGLPDPYRAAKLSLGAYLLCWALLRWYQLDIMPRSKEIQEQMRKKVIEIYQSGKGYKAISKASGTPANHSESHYPQMAKTWNSGEPSQEWLADQNYPKSAATTHAKRSQKTPQQHPKNCRPHLPQL
ncbi:hypothetical protein L3Q82_017865, partial [Scortum barcoo]